MVNAFHGKKLDALEDLVESANGRPVLVAYWFKHDLTRIMERLKKLKADCRKLDSDESIREWNAGKILVGLIHPASAGHGLNLEYPCMVRADVEPGTVPADGCKALEAGTEIRDSFRDTYRD